MKTLQNLFRIPPVNAPIKNWHVSPGIDMAAYAFSWVWVLIPMMAISGLNRFTDYTLIYLLVVTLTFAHRHVGYPYVYMDRQVFNQHPFRFVFFPTALFLIWAASPFLQTSEYRISFTGICALLGLITLAIQVMRKDREGFRIPKEHYLKALIPAFLILFLLGAFTFMFDAELGWAWLAFGFTASWMIETLTLRHHKQTPQKQESETQKPRFISPVLISLLLLAPLFLNNFVFEKSPTFRLQQVINITAVFAALWNIWHVVQQKYGILRLYNAKSASEIKTPGWIDRLLVWCWVPLYFSWLGPEYKSLVLRNFSRGRPVLKPLLTFLTEIQIYILIPSIALIMFAVTAFTWHEYKAHRFQNRARLLMGLGTTLLSSTFLWVDPIKAYLAYAFSHAVEYTVFVWAFQRKRYAAPLAHKPLLGRVLKKPWLSYSVFILGISAIFLYFNHWGRLIFPDADRPEFLGFTTIQWIGLWNIYQSMVHFYYDGFLWKMRLPIVRENL